MPTRAPQRGPRVIDFRVEQEDTVYPMVPAGADLHEMIRRPTPIVETGDDDRVDSETPCMHTFTVYVEDKPGVLNRVASLFRRRAFNIDSLTVGHTETPGVSRMTVVVDTDEGGARRIEANLYKLIHVRQRRRHHRRVRRSSRDLALIKVGADRRDAGRRSCSWPRSSAPASSTSRPSRWSSR